MHKITKYIMVHISMIFLLTGTSFADNNTTDQNSTVDNNNTIPIIVNYLLGGKTFVNKLKMPTFTGLSQGELVIECQDDVVYYIMAYNCLRGDTRPSVTTSVGQIVTEENGHVGEGYNEDEPAKSVSIYYTKGHVERSHGESVTIIGEVYSGGDTIPFQWIKKCN